METHTTELQRRHAQLAHHLRARFGDMGAGMLRAIFEHVTWVQLRAGEVLMEQGQAGDDAYLSLSGRLRVYVRGADGDNRMVRELGRGEIIGEISLYTGEPRSATVVAIRHTVLARIGKAQFDGLVSRYPQASMALTRQIIHRLQTQLQPGPLPAPVMVSLQPISEGVDVAAFAQRLQASLAEFGQAVCVTADGVRERAGPQGSEAAVLDELEAAHDFVLMVGDPDDVAWTALCTEHSDEVLLLAQADEPADLHPIEQLTASDGPRRTEAAKTLVLLHPADRRSPLGMRRWLAPRRVTAHVNLRPALDRDMARLARLLSRRAVGLVLAGGGARGFAHLGIWKALRERGIEVDCVGGTSMGAVMAAVIAADGEVDETLGIAREAFRINPTGDYNWLPMLSLIKGRRVRQVVHRSIERLTGGPADIVDLWKGFFCIASNYSQGQEMCLTQGDLGQSLLASIAIPGALPPVVRDGDLLCDGGTFNNFPVNVMRDMRGVGQVIGVDLGARNPRRLDFDEVPSSWALLRDRWRGRARRRYRLPSLISYLLNVTILYSVSRQDESRRLCDLYFNPPLARVGLLQWNRFDHIVRQGEAHAREVLDQRQAPTERP